MNQKVLKIFFCFLLSIGAVGFSYSLKIPAYKDLALYESQYMALASNPSSLEASEKFQALRESQLTSKYKIQDYSLTFFSIGVVVFFLFILGGMSIKSFHSKKKIIFLGITSAIFTSCASYSSLILDFKRGELPWWSDSLAIPLIQEIPWLIALLVWAIIHSLILRKDFECGKPILRLEVFKSNYWLSLITILWLFFLLDAIAKGVFMMVIPHSLWIYYYLSLAAGRENKSPAASRVKHQDQNNSK